MELRIAIDKNEYWVWCCDFLLTGTWRKKIGIIGTTATYIFDNPEDATLFKLSFGL